MASPQLENGYTRIANEIMNALIKYRIAGEQMQCLLHIIRQTYGWGRKSDKISITQFEKATAGSVNGIYGGIKDIIYYEHTLSRRQIAIVSKE